MASTTAVALLLAQGMAFGLTDDERKCSDTVNKRGRNVGNQEQKGNRTCVKDGSASIETCVAGTSSKANDQEAKLAEEYLAGGKCNPAPPFGIAVDANTAALEVTDASDAIIRGVFGDPADGLVAGDKCADAVAKRGGKKFDTAMKAFRGCAKNLGAINTIADLEGCRATAINDAKTTGVQGKLAADMANTGKCPSFPVAGADDGDCSTAVTAGTFATCAGDIVDCQACLAMTGVIGSANVAPCDLLDDGAANGSCGGYPALNIGSHACTLDTEPLLCVGGPNNGMPCSIDFDCSPGGSCLTTGSRIDLRTQGVAFSLPADGSLTIDCDTTAPTGKAACDCIVNSFDPIVIPSIGDVCIDPVAGCPAGEIDCDGGNSLNIDTRGEHNIGACGSNAACSTSCDTFCNGFGVTYDQISSGCEAFCDGGVNDEDPCTRDTDCPGAACVGGEPVAHPGVCGCLCGGTQLGAASDAGSLSCYLGIQIDVQLPSDGDCDIGDPTPIKLSPLCGPITSEGAAGQINDTNNTVNKKLPPGMGSTQTGAGIDCNTLASSTTTGLKLVGGLGFYDSTLGDIYSAQTLLCE